MSRKHPVVTKYDRDCGVWRCRYCQSIVVIPEPDHCPLCRTPKKDAAYVR